MRKSKYTLRKKSVTKSDQFQSKRKIPWTPKNHVGTSQRTEFADKLDYAFAYGEELAKLLRGPGFKSTVGLTLEGPEAESDFTVLLANMSHVFGPIARDEFTKLLDLDFEYDEYHLTLNELPYVVLPTLHKRRVQGASPLYSPVCSVLLLIFPGIPQYLRTPLM
ncbi:hypothetical protein CYMTET_54962 [Cymbomonas tetramitiformis]|uniref:Uncharacterized protein n=1 Tax=Cymbomonas tetramitiformis TaxID=36881 RepID=A0AAE0BF28_9CHLO|nr:hypothetical protein CYMTET_54962 [Cymbomonas tetramitiformis]